MSKLFLSLVIILGCATGIALAATMTTTTGKGYFTYGGQVIGYYNYPPGTYNISAGVSAVDTNGTPNEVINQTAENSYMCSQSPSNPGC